MSRAVSRTVFFDQAMASSAVVRVGEANPSGRCAQGSHSWHR
jgi:hypothetical protein